MEEFVVTVGLSAKPSPGIASVGELVRPEWSVGAYKITIKLVLDGFMPTRGGTNLITLDVTADDPHPTEDVYLMAVAGGPFEPLRTLHAEYSIDGQLIGSASRPIIVGSDTTAEVEARPERGWDMSMPPGVPTPDLTISITRGNSAAEKGRLIWDILSPHGEIDTELPTKETDYKSFIGDKTENWARGLMNAVNQNAENAALEVLMEGNGAEIRENIPVWIRRSLRDLATLFPDQSGQRPTVLLVSDEANIPWELAYIVLDGGREDYLGAAFNVGRWVRGYEDVDGNLVPTYPPPTKHTIRSMAVVSGDYTMTKEWKKLKGAEEEASELESTYHATAVPADEDLARWLSREADCDSIHFAVHGNWSLSGSTDGIVLMDGTTLTPKQVRAAKLKRRPFVFLNACQLGQGEETLGDYGGIAAAFLKAGASGVIASLWNVDDTQAKQLAIDFYKSIDSTASEPGELFRQQRTAFGDGTKSKLSLAYLFFGHPNLRMTLDIPEPEPSSEV